LKRLFLFSALELVSLTALETESRGALNADLIWSRVDASDNWASLTRFRAATIRGCGKFPHFQRRNERTNLGVSHFKCTADTVLDGLANLLLDESGRKRVQRLVE
jgi:hypothetical protein